jgi:hypothetical protein
MSEWASGAAARRDHQRTERAERERMDGDWSTGQETEFQPGIARVGAWTRGHASRRGYNVNRWWFEQLIGKSCFFIASRFWEKYTVISAGSYIAPNTEPHGFLSTMKRTSIRQFFKELVLGGGVLAASCIPLGKNV